MMQLGGELSDLPPVLDYLSLGGRFLLAIVTVVLIAEALVLIERKVDALSESDDAALDLDEQLDLAFALRCEVCQQTADTLVPVKLFRGEAQCCNACLWLMHEGRTRGAA
jgi:hypothetical protein